MTEHDVASLEAPSAPLAPTGSGGLGGVPRADAVAERAFHSYASNHIPWWVRAMWIGYWIGAFYYVTRYVVPMVRMYFSGDAAAGATLGP